MPRFADTTKRDPYRNFNFKILIDNQVVAACKKMSKLSASVDVVKFRSGNSSSAVTELMPGRVSYDPVTLEAGLTNDKTFETWATMLMRNEATPGDRVTDPNFRKDIQIQVLDLDNKTVVRKYTLYRAWCSKFTAVSDLVGDANEVIIESIQIEHEGFKREDTNAV
ncbi:phage tail protein [Sorangium sp. So ce341]|uniref:phage tail protein n=1 Tax=Sorangium sp. So ce341 TaxID=3133302 RepID=UPI003F5EAFB2